MRTFEPAQLRGVPQLGEIVGDKYRLESMLGRGGMGTVFAARHTLSQRRVALKWLDPELHACHDSRERFLHEAEALGRIEHPNVVTVLDVGTGLEGSFLVMELLRGESLRAFLERSPRLSPREAVALLLPVVAGIEAAHRAGVIHRDLKPENLFVSRADPLEPPVVRILDFGVAKLEGCASNISGITSTAPLNQTGQQLGTPRYMAPEQIVGAKTDARTDVWGLGSILYEMLAGRSPFEGHSEAHLFMSIATEPPQALAELAPATPPPLASAIARALSKNADDRHPSAAIFGRAIGECVGARFREPRHSSSQRVPAISAARFDAPTRARRVGAAAPANAIVTKPAPPTRRPTVRWIALLALLLLASGAALVTSEREASLGAQASRSRSIQP